MAANARSLWASDDSAVIQAIADATVIDAQCRTTHTMYGAVFRYGETHDIHTNDILLLGARHKELQAAMAWRLKTTTRDEICGSLHAQYRQAFPDWFITR